MTEEKHPIGGETVEAVSPIGSTAASAHARRMVQNPEYAREWDMQATAREIAWQLVRYRMDHQLTQEELARMVGTSHSQISRLESGQHLPSVATLGKIASALHLRLSISLEPWPEAAIPALD
jgi:DNA-binding XRE family transcriptional regulator